jgi:hypothetical protein
VEYRGGTLYIERPEDVTMHAHVFDLIRATAKGPEESTRYISDRADKLDEKGED